MIKWTKPNGNSIETNDREETIEYARSLGWTREGEKAPKPEKQDATPKAKGRGRPKKSD